MFCTIFVSLSVANILENYVRSSSYLVQVFFKENLHSHGKFTEQLFLLRFFYIKFFEQIFWRAPICSWWKKNQQNLSTKIKTWARKCLLEFMYLGEIILHKTDFAILTVLPCVTSWAMCFTDKYLRRNSPNNLRGKSTTARNI